MGLRKSSEDGGKAKGLPPGSVNARRRLDAKGSDSLSLCTEKSWEASYCADHRSSHVFRALFSRIFEVYHVMFLRDSLSAFLKVDMYMPRRKIYSV